MKLRRLYVLLIALLILLAAVPGFTYYYLNNRIHNMPSALRDEIVIVPRGMGLKSIARVLRDKEVIDSDLIFAAYVMSMGWQNSLKAGEYGFSKGDTMAEVARKLVSGDVVKYNVTIPEGLTVRETAELLDNKDIFDAEEFLDCLESKKIDGHIPGSASASYEGYLFPDTYSYVRGVTCGDFIDMMLNRFDSVFSGFEAKRQNVNLTDGEILTLASMVEKETGNAGERPLISAVFQNRLRIGMKLDSDPTVIYGLGEDFDGNLTRKDLDTYTVYNTYMIKGLPPGPIANPGKESISAVLNPADVGYLYFVSKGDGTHEFSASYRDHQRAVNRYQR